MNKFIRIKNIVIVMLCVTVIAMATGYIILSIQFDNIENQQPNFSVSFTNVKKVSSIKGGIKEPVGDIKIDSTGKIADMSFVLYEAHDELDYEITIKNQGNMNASVMDLMISPNFNDSEIMKLYNPITLSVSSIGGRILEPGEETTIKLSVFYNSVENQTEKMTKKINAKIGLLAESTTEE